MKSEIKKTALLRMYARSIFAICFTFVLIISFAGGMPVETEAQTASAPVILPVDYSGAVDTSGTAQWYADQGEYEVIIGGLPSSAGATNQLLNIYLANPQNNHRFLILSTPPTANATDTYSLPLSQVSKMPPGKYELILVYTFSDGQSESFTATSPASVRIGPSQSSSSNQSANQTGSQNGFSGDNSSTPSPLTSSPAAPVVTVGSSAAQGTTANGTSPTGSTGSVAAPVTPSSPSFSGLVVCNGAVDSTDPGISNTQAYKSSTPCDFNAFLLEARTVIDWLFAVAVPLAIALCAYGGFLYITGTEKNRTKANAIFTAAAIGFGIMLVAWVGVYTIVGWITNSKSGLTTFLGGN